MSKINEIGEAYILLHMDCELRCKVCPYLGDRGACKNKVFNEKYGGGKKLDIRRLKRFVDELLPYKPKVITLSGGEPLDYKNWDKLAEYIKSKGIQVAMSTNGLRIHENLENLVHYVDTINLNPGGKAIELIEKGNESVYSNDFLKNILNIVKLKNKLRKKRPEIRFVYIITDSSYRYMKEFYEIFKSREIEINEFLFQHMMYLTSDKLEKQKRLWQKLGLSTALWEGYNIKFKHIDFKKFIEQVRYLAKFNNVEFSPKLSEQEIKQYYDPNRKNEIKRNIKCVAPWNQVDLYPNGDIMVCPDYVIGNIYENTFDEIWNSKRIIWLRKLLNKGKIFPGCNACFYYYISDEDPYKE